MVAKWLQQLQTSHPLKQYPNARREPVLPTDLTYQTEKLLPEASSTFCIMSYLPEMGQCTLLNQSSPKGDRITMNVFLDWGGVISWASCHLLDTQWWVLYDQEEEEMAFGWTLVCVCYNDQSQRTMLSAVQWLVKVWAHLKPIRDNSEHFAVVIRERHLLVPEIILGKSCGSHLVSWGAWKQSQHKKENEVEPRMVERSISSMTYSKSLNPGFRVNSGSKSIPNLSAKKVRFCLIQLGLGFLFLATERSPSDTNGEQGRPSLCAYEIHSQMGEAGAKQRIISVIWVTKIKCRRLADHIRQTNHTDLWSEKPLSQRRCQDGCVFQHLTPVWHLYFSDTAGCHVGKPTDSILLWHTAHSFIHSPNTPICSKAAKNDQFLLFLHSFKSFALWRMTVMSFTVKCVFFCIPSFPV